MAALILLIVLDAMFVHDRLMKKTEACVDYLHINTYVGAVMGILMMVAMVLTRAAYSVLASLDLTYLSVLIFLLIIAGLITVCEIFLKKAKPAYAELLGNSLLFLSANCAVFGVAIDCAMQGLGFGASFLQSVFCGIGFLLIMLIMPGLYEKIDSAPIPACFRGLPIALLTAGIMYVSFIGMTGLFA